MKYGKYMRGVHPATRFWSKVRKTESCWLWMGARNKDGHGNLWVKPRVVYAHVFAYELLVGKVPNGLELDHLCRVPYCVNPAHLEAVTHRENVLRGVGTAAIHARKTHCKRGHLLAGDNIHKCYLPWRICKLCCKITAKRRARCA